jgi:hypothetical protein
MASLPTRCRENRREYLLGAVALLVALEFSISCHRMHLVAFSPLLRL